MGRGPRGRSSGGRKSFLTGWPRFRSKPSSLSTKSSSTPDKDEKASPSTKVETTHGDQSRSEGFYSSIIDGFNWGTGNAMGHRFIEAIFGPRTIKIEAVSPKKVEVEAVSANDDNEKFKDYTESCSISYNAFQECLYAEGNNLKKCHIFMDSLFECKRNSSSFNF